MLEQDLDKKRLWSPLLLVLIYASQIENKDGLSGLKTQMTPVTGITLELDHLAIWPRG